MTLHFYAQGGYQKSIGHDHIMPMSQASVSRCIAEVTDAINNNMHYYIHFPITEEARNSVKEGLVKSKKLTFKK